MENHTLITSNTISIDGRDIHYLRRKGKGTNNPVIICLHGFPENAHAWEPLISELPLGYDIIAPDLPGYHKSEPLTPIGEYKVNALIERMASFIDRVCMGRKVTLIGHDWGGAIAWPLAAFKSSLFSRLIIINAAHPSTFTRALINSEKQRAKSDYIHSLVCEDAEKELLASNFALLKDMLGRELFDTHSDYAEMLLNSWKNTSNLSAMLNYYRLMPQLPPKAKASESALSSLRVPSIHIKIPTIVLWGRNDVAFEENILDDLSDYVEDLNIHYHDTATHWVHREQASWAAKCIRTFVGTK